MKLKIAAVAIISLFFTQLKIFAQDTSLAYSPERKAKAYFIHFKNDSCDTYIVPFRNIHVNDVRPDTTKFGYFRSNVTNTLNKICTPPDDMNKYYRSFLTNDPNSSYDLEIFITKAWIFSDFNKDANIDKVSLSAEVFMKSDAGFHPLYKFDTVMGVEGTLKNSIGTLMRLMKRSMDKIMTVNQAQKIKKTLSVSEIEERYHASRYAFTKPTNKGVYKNFAEYKQDQPSNPDFQVNFGIATDELYLKQPDGSYLVNRESWGFFDGKVLFIKIGENYFPVDQDGSALNFFAASYLRNQGATHLTLPPTMISAATIVADYMLSTKKRKLVKLKPYQLNVLTGEVY